MYRCWTAKKCVPSYPNTWTFAELLLNKKCKIMIVTVLSCLSVHSRQSYKVFILFTCMHHYTLKHADHELLLSWLPEVSALFGFDPQRFRPFSISALEVSAPDIKMSDFCHSLFCYSWYPWFPINSYQSPWLPR